MVMAVVYTYSGDFDSAIDELEYLLSIPSWCTPTSLRADPVFTPLHDLPRFQELLKQYEK